MEFTTWKDKKLDKTFVIRKRTEKKITKNSRYNNHPDADYTDLWIAGEMKQYFKYIDPQKTDVWADFGANIGLFGVLIHDKVKKIYGYEPHPENCIVLKENIRYNKINNYKLIEKAVVGNSELKNVTFYLQKDMACHSLAKRKRATIGEMIVLAIDITQIFIDHPDINKVKMDIEGTEYDVILSYNKWNKIHELLFEWHSRPNKDKSEEYATDTKYKELIDYVKLFYNTVNYSEKLRFGTGMVHCKNPKEDVNILPRINQFKKLF